MLGEGNALGSYFGGGWVAGCLSYTVVRGRQSEGKAGSRVSQASRLPAISCLPPELQTPERLCSQEPRTGLGRGGSDPGPPSPSFP